MTNSDVFDYPELNSARIRDEKINALMTAATGAATLLAVVSVVAFLGFIVLLGGAWLAVRRIAWNQVSNGDNSWVSDLGRANVS